AGYDGFSCVSDSGTFATSRSGCGEPARRGSITGGRYGVHFFCAPWDVRPDGLLVSVCLSVRGAVHSHDDRHRHTRGTVSHPGDGRACLLSVAADELVARCGVEQRVDRGSLGLSHRHRQHLDTLAVVRCSESAAWYLVPL